NQFDTCACGFHDGVGSAWWWYENTACAGSCDLHCFFYGVENGQAFNGCATFTWCHSTNHVGTCGNHVARVELSFAACYSLNNDSCCVVKQNAHAIVLNY